MQRRTHINFGTGNVIATGTSVYVYTDSGLTTLASLYDDDETTPLSNPLTVDANGEFYYKTTNGYRYEKIGGEAAAELLFFDPADWGVYRNDGDTGISVMIDPADPTRPINQVGEENWIIGQNMTGSPIADGTPVAIPLTSSSSGDNPRVEPLDVTNPSSCRCFVGLASETIAHGSTGVVTRLGFVRGINTQAFNEGDRLWVAPGATLTATEPTAGNKVLAGMVIKKAASGIILSNPRPFEMTSPHEVAGMNNRTESTISFVDGTRTFSITPTSTRFYYFTGDGAKASTGASVVIPDTVGMHYIYFNASGTLTASTSPWDITSVNAPVATVYWSGTSGWLGDERHAPRNYASRLHHDMLHDTVGSRYGTGLTGTFTNTTLSLTSGTIYDEDIEHAIGAKTVCRLIYRNASLQMVSTANSSTPYAVSGGTLQYDNAGTLTNVTAGRYIANWVYATNDPTYPIYIQVGQAQYTTVASARNAAQIFPSNINTREWKLLYQIIYQNSGGTPTYVEANDYRSVSSLPGAVVSSLPASSVVFVPSGNIAATNVQAALEELDSEKIAKEATITARAADFNSSAIAASGNIQAATAALTCTLETYTDRNEGFQFAVNAIGGNVTFAGTFVGSGGKTVLAQGDVAYVLRGAASWYVFGVTA